MKNRTAPFALLFAATVAMHFGTARAADHEDGSITEDRPADISDFHAFVNPNNGNIVLSMAINGFSVPGFINRFAPDTLLQIKIDNTGDLEEDLVVQFVFETQPSPDAASDTLTTQLVKVLGPARPGGVGAENRILKKGPELNGIVGQGVFKGNGIKAFAGPTDDATWADLIFVESLLLGFKLGREPGIDTVQGLNAATVAVELAPDALTGPDGDIIRVWATVSRQRETQRSTDKAQRDSGPWIQVDRVGIPAVNPLLIPGPRKDEYNRAIPSEDVELFRDDVIAAILGLNGGDQEHAEFAAGILLPDVFVLDTSMPTQFPRGRMPASDFVDASLGLLSNGAIVTDGLDANDVRFLDDFPFFPPGHTPDEFIPARN